MSQIQQAHISGQPVTVVVNGRTIQYEPNLLASGITIVEDVENKANPLEIERHMICTICGAYNAMRISLSK